MFVRSATRGTVSAAGRRHPVRHQRRNLRARGRASFHGPPPSRRALTLELLFLTVPPGPEPVGRRPCLSGVRDLPSPSGRPFSIIGMFSRLRTRSVRMAEKITPRDKDYSQWYLDIVKEAGLAENSDVRGCMVIKPHGY